MSVTTGEVLQVQADPPGHELAGWTTVKVVGDLDGVRAGDVRAGFAELAAAGGAKILVDLSGTTFVDSAGIGVLIGTFRRLEEAGGEMRIAAPQRSIAALLRLTGISSVVPVYDSVGAAAERDLGGR